MLVKQKTAQAGVYKIQNMVNGKMYIGSSRNISQRWKTHVRKLNKGVHDSKKLQNSYHKHGGINFSFEIILICEIDCLIMYEQKIMDAYNVVNDGYNVCSLAGTRSAPHTEETKIKMSKTRTGRKYSEEHRSRISEGLMGKKLSPEHINALKKSFVGRKMHPNTRASLKMANTDRLVTKETREKIGAAHRGKKISDEAKLKMSLAAKKRWVENPIIHTDEIRKKMSDAAKKRFSTERLKAEQVSIVENNHRCNNVGAQ